MAVLQLTRPLLDFSERGVGHETNQTLHGAGQGKLAGSFVMTHRR